MSCLSFKKLFPAKKTWRRMIRFKFQGKLHKSKVIKKPNRSMKKTSKKKLTWPNFCIFQRKKKLKKPRNPSSTLPTTYKYYFQKTASPVYIDQLFIEPPTVPNSVIKAKAVCHSIVTLKGTEASNTSNTSSARKLVGDYGGEMKVGTTSRDEEEGCCHHHHSADEMWESMAESPHMNEINERAEEFIASFRAEMQLQEIIARRL